MVISFKKIFFKSALAFSLASSMPLSASFIPLTEEDKKVLTTTYEVPFETITTIEAEKVRLLPDELKIKVDPILLISNIVELGKEEKGIILSFEPYALAPKVMIPAGFPLDMNSLILNYLSGEEIDCNYYNKDFGRLESKVTILGTNFEIGSKIEQFSFSSAYFLNQFALRNMILSKIGLARICQNNKDLMDTVRFIFEEHNKNLHNINFPRIKELSNLLAYALGVKVLDKPETGISLQINNYKIPMRGRMNHKKYKKILKTQMRNFLGSLKLTYDVERHSLVRLEK